MFDDQENLRYPLEMLHGWAELEKNITGSNEDPDMPLRNSLHGRTWPRSWAEVRLEGCGSQGSE